MRRLALLSFVLLAGCTQSDTPMQTVSPMVTVEDGPHVPAYRVTITRIGVFDDSIAYAGQRGIYIITDHKTGKEFIGISGIGISETGEHKDGKTTHQDER